MTGSVPETRKILGLVVHGIGDQKPGSTLRSFMKDFFPLSVPAFTRRPQPPQQQMRQKWRQQRQQPWRRRGRGSRMDVNPLDDNEKPEVTITFSVSRPDAPHVRYQLIVREVHWAQAFAPPSLGGLLSGLKTLLSSWLQHVRGYDQSSAVNAIQWLSEKGLPGFFANLLFFAWFVALLVYRALEARLPLLFMLLFADRHAPARYADARPWPARVVARSRSARAAGHPLVRQVSAFGR